ncbi:MAG: hypothetical protein EOP49_21285, partial [Sphingobacteriales bacterium]
GTMIKVFDYNKIKRILLERTGMGESGESYLVGDDFRMRSQSRFYPNKTPYTIAVKTKGVANAFKGINGRGVFEDYREAGGLFLCKRRTIKVAARHRHCL